MEKIILRNPDGYYLENWQYSQGYFDFSLTNDPTLACDVSREKSVLLISWANKFVGWQLVTLTN